METCPVYYTLCANKTNDNPIPHMHHLLVRVTEGGRGREEREGGREGGGGRGREGGEGGGGRGDHVMSLPAISLYGVFAYSQVMPRSVSMETPW